MNGHGAFLVGQRLDPPVRRDLDDSAGRAPSSLCGSSRAVLVVILARNHDLPSLHPVRCHLGQAENLTSISLGSSKFAPLVAEKQREQQFVLLIFGYQNLIVFVKFVSRPIGDRTKSVVDQTLRSLDRSVSCCLEASMPRF